MRTALVFLILAGQARSEDFQVEVNPEIYSPADFQHQGVKSRALPTRLKRPDALPEKTERDSVFAKVPDLSSEIKSLDELDRDLLFVRARTKSLSELKRLYPNIKEKTLASLRKEIQHPTQKPR